MQKNFIALALSFALQTAMAGTPPADLEAGTTPAGGLMHAKLVVPAQPTGVAQHGADPAGLTANLQAAGSGPHEEGRGRDHTGGMLLAALALMIGIVLRRWGTDR